MVNMFLRQSKSRGHTYLKIVRSYRSAGKVKQEILFTLGRLDFLSTSGELEGLVKALSRYCDKQHWIDLAKDLSIQQIYYLGAAHVLKRMLERTGVSGVLKKVEQSHSRLKNAWSVMIEGMIIGRFISPCSKRRLKEHWWSKVYPDFLPVGEPSLSGIYRAMDILHEHRDEVERVLFDRR